MRIADMMADCSPGPHRYPDGVIAPTIVIAGSPTALGGHFAGMETSPIELRRLGLRDRLAARPALSGVTWLDHGDAANDPGWVPDPDPRAKNRDRIVDYLGRLATHVQTGLVQGGEDARLLVLGGDCTSHAGAMAGIRRARPDIRLGLAWFDAHGDFNTPDTTPSGNVWGMPFAMACGRGDQVLVAAAEGPTVAEHDAALFGGQVLDESESRMLAASGVAQFGPGMLTDPAGQAAAAAWAGVVSERIDAWYVAFDMDALDASGRWSVATPEPDGLALDTAVAAVRGVATSGAPVIGFGATAVMRRDDADMEATIDAIAALAEAALAVSEDGEARSG
jgi:arginase